MATKASPKKPAAKGKSGRIYVPSLALTAEKKINHRIRVMAQKKLKSSFRKKSFQFFRTEANPGRARKRTGRKVPAKTGI